MTFLEKLDAAVTKNNSLLCVGLDPDIDKLLAQFDLQSDETPFFTFNKAIIDATADLVCAYKPNSAFFEGLGASGVTELKMTCDYVRETYPEIPVILDFKRGDIGNTNHQYAAFAFGYLQADAITIQPYLGQEAVQVFLDYEDKGIIVLCKTSNSGSGEFQDLQVNGRKLYLEVADNVKNKWNAHNNCLLVVGATYPAEIAEVRQLVGDDMVLLIPGLGAQGGNTEAIIQAAKNTAGRGMIINSSRDILYASVSDDYAEAARAHAQAVRDEINQYRGV